MKTILFRAIIFIFLFLLSCGDDEKLFSATVKEIKASSFVVKNGLYRCRYHPYWVLDNDPLTACNEGAEGTGLDEWIEIRFKKPVKAGEIKIMPGYYDPQWYAQNNRVRRLVINLDENVIKKELTDGMDEKTIALGREITFSTFKLVIKNVYKGSAYDDTCISEICFFLHGRVIALNLDTARKSMEKEAHYLSLPIESPTGKIFKSYGMMGVGSEEYFFSDGTYVHLNIRIEHTWWGDRTIGKWKLEGDNIKVSDIYRCRPVGKGRVVSIPPGYWIYYEDYDYTISKEDKTVSIDWRHNYLWARNMSTQDKSNIPIGPSIVDITVNDEQLKNPNRIARVDELISYFKAQFIEWSIKHPEFVSNERNY